MAVRPAASALLLAISLSAQTPSVPYAQFFGPLLEDHKAALTYPQRFRSIRDVDFRNLPFHLSAEDDQITFEEVHYLTPAGTSAPEFALVILTSFSAGGSSTLSGVAQLFRLTSGRLEVAQELVWDEHFDAKSKYSFDARTNTLVVRAAHYLPGDAHCCVSAMDVFTLRWTGAAFVRKSMSAELSDYGKRAGKTLPR